MLARMDGHLQAWWLLHAHCRGLTQGSQGKAGGDLKDARWWLILILAYLTL